MAEYHIIYINKHSKNKHRKPIEIGLGIIGLFIIVFLDLVYSYIRGKYSLLIPIGVITPITLLILYLLLDNKITLINKKNNRILLYNNALLLQNLLKSGARISIHSKNIVEVQNKHKKIALPDGLIDINKKVIDFRLLETYLSFALAIIALLAKTNVVYASEALGEVSYNYDYSSTALVIKLIAIIEFVGFIAIYRICKNFGKKNSAIGVDDRWKEENIEINDTYSLKNNDNKKIFWLLCNKVKIISWTLYIVAVVFIFSFVIDINYVASGSMEPTLMTGDIQVSFKLGCMFKTPNRGDIVSFYSKELNEIMGKRVIGVAGDKIEFNDGSVYINGIAIDESAYLDNGVKTYCMDSFEVPNGCVFVLGDNREKSNDSRFFENPYIKISDIRDRHIFCIPLSKI